MDDFLKSLLRDRDSMDDFFDENNKTNEEITKSYLLSLLKKLRIKRNRMLALETQLKELSKEISLLESVEIPNFLKDRNYKDISLQDGNKTIRVKLKNFFYARIKKTNENEAYDFLKKFNAFDGKVKQKVSFQVKNDIETDFVQTILKQSGFEPTTENTIHYKSLESGFKNILGYAEGSTPEILLAEIPKDLFNVFRKEIVDIKETEKEFNEYGNNSKS